jgi:hypothetical protein
MSIAPSVSPIDHLHRQRKAILSLAADGKTYASLDLAYRYLPLVQRDPQVVVLMLKQLLRLGLGGPARELLDLRHDLEGAEAELRQLRQIVAAAPTGRVPWESTRAVFEANMRALKQALRQPDDALDTLSDALRGCTMHRGADGLPHVSRKSDGGFRRWIPALTNYAELAAIEIRVADLSRATLILGVGLHSFVESVVQKTRGRKEFGAVPLFLVEPNAARFAAWLHCGDRVAVLTDPRMHVFFGPQAIAAFERFLEDNDDLECPTLRLTCYVDPDVMRLVDEVSPRIRAQRDDRLQAIITSAASVRVTDAQWAERLAPGARILGLSSRFTTMLQYSMRDIGDALRSLGYQFHMHLECANHRCTTTLSVRKCIESFDPALIVLINHLRYKDPRIFCDRPILTWIQDPMDNLLCAKAGASIGPRDFVCGYYRDRCISEFGYPAEQFLDNWFFPVSTRMFHDEPPTDDQMARYAADIVYVGHCHGSPRTVCQQAQRQYPHLHALIAGVVDQMLQLHRSGAHVPGLDGETLIQPLAATLGVSVPRDQADAIASWVAMRVFDMAFRHETLEWVARWATRTGRRFRIYGKGWDTHPLFSRWACGPLAHGEELRVASCCATLSLQTIHTGFAHQRTYEALASGSLVLARWTPWTYGGVNRAGYLDRRASGAPSQGVATLFPDLDPVTFHTEREFGERADHYLADAPARAEMLQRLRSTVIERFSYQSVMPSILDRIRRSLAGAAATVVKG